MEDSAEKDFDAIIHYLMTNYSHASATKAVLAIKKKILSLEKFPESNPVYHKSSGKRNLTYRYIVAKKVHRIIFTILVEDLRVIISRITHARADKGGIIRSLEEE
ncbi:type II toxin-antitoxin system RelE/ParE family toxin [Neolewinella agarilytica]